jgi:hypothetical protein
MGTSQLPAAAAVTVSAMVACLVSFVEVLITTVFLPRISSVFFDASKKYWHLVHVDDPAWIMLRSLEHWTDKVLELLRLLAHLTGGFPTP